VSGASHRRKGDRFERQLIKNHQSVGVHAERYPLSGASRFRGSSHDIDIYAFGRGAAPLVAEVKARKNGAGFSMLEEWLGDCDALFVRRNNAEPLVVLPWRIWARLLEEKRPIENSAEPKQLIAFSPRAKQRTSAPSTEKSPSQRPYTETPSFGMRRSMTARSKVKYGNPKKRDAVEC
jgi:Holliday junction resolvase